MNLSSKCWPQGAALMSVSSKCWPQGAARCRVGGGVSCTSIFLI